MKSKIIRIIVATISILFIMYLWIRNDIVSIYMTMPKEEIAPMIITTIAATLLKVVVVFSVVYLAKTIISIIKKHNKNNDNSSQAYDN